MFCDETTIYAYAGKGGDGSVSFRKEKYVPFGGPDGGDGGEGGNVVLLVDPNIHTLAEFNTKKHFHADPGGGGMKKNMHGKNGEDLILKVPPGTLVYSHDKKEVIADLTTNGQQFTVAKGGRGGFGNAHFTSATRKTPRFAELGEPGEEIEVVLEIKLIAEVGIIGLPSVGKSTFISHVSNAKPKIAEYHFTTLVPNLGVVELSRFGGDKSESFVIADLPGLIEGASEGKGLGHQFLKHSQRTKILLHFLDITDDNAVKNYETINKELKKYDEELAQKEQILVINKIDSIPEELRKEFAEDIAERAGIKEYFAISGVTGEGVRNLLFVIWNKIAELRKKEVQENPVETVKVIKPAAISNDKDVSIHPIEKKGEIKHFKLEGKRLEQIVVMSDLSNEEAVHRVHDVLKKMGVIKKLLRHGAQDGDILHIGNAKIEFLNILD